MKKTRTCTNPGPQFGGTDCSDSGPELITTACNPQNCPGQFPINTSVLNELASTTSASFLAISQNAIKSEFNVRIRARTHWTDKICLARPKISTKFVSAKFSIW